MVLRTVSTFACSYELPLRGCSVPARRTTASASRTATTRSSQRPSARTSLGNSARRRERRPPTCPLAPVIATGPLRSVSIKPPLVGVRLQSGFFILSHSRQRRHGLPECAQPLLGELGAAIAVNTARPQFPSRRSRLTITT